MKNKQIIETTLNELGIIYKYDEMIRNDVTIDAYLIHLISDNTIFWGGILDGGASDDKHITIMFFCNLPSKFKGTSINRFLPIINELNRGCKYGNFTCDNEDIIYTLSIPLINNTTVPKPVFKFYFENVISIVKGASVELQNAY